MIKLKKKLFLEKCVLNKMSAANMGAATIRQTKPQSNEIK
jgi:hypothetical protein